jgi:hypothetical protein
MFNLQRRLRKLEAQLTDEHGLVPHSPQWLAYWSDWMEKRMRGENPPGRIPLEAFHAIIEAGSRPEDA